MSSLEIILDKENFKQGEKINGNLVLDLKKDAKVKEIKIEIYGVEHTEMIRRVGKTNVTYTEDYDIIKESVNLIDQVANSGQYDTPEKEEVLTKNVYTLPFSFTLPEDATLSYEGEHAKVKYKISAKIDVPWKLDLKAFKELSVSTKDVPEEKGTATVLHEKKGSSILPQALSPDIDMTVELNKTHFKRGEYAEGKIVVTNKSGKAIRNIVLDLYACEHAEAEGHKEDSTVMKHNLKIPVNLPEVNYFEQGFKLLIPEDVTPTLKRKYFSIEWYFQVGLDVEKATDIKTEIPVVVK